MITTIALFAQNHGWGMHGWDGGWMWLWGAALMALWIAVIGAVAWLVVRSARGRSGSARSILDERLARGEITIEEHRERTDALRSRE